MVVDFDRDLGGQALPLPSERLSRMNSPIHGACRDGSRAASTAA